MLARLHGSHGTYGVGVVWSGNYHRINAFANFVEHLAVIHILFGIWKIVETTFGILPVDVSKGNHVFRLHVVEVYLAFSPDTDAGDVEFVAGSDVSETAHGITRDNSKHSGCSCR
jgi:hypothetical protein